MDHVNNGSYQLPKKDPSAKTKAMALIINYIIILSLLTRLSLDFIVNQKYTSQEFLYILLFHIVAPRCTILTNT